MSFVPLWPECRVRKSIQESIDALESFLDHPNQFFQPVRLTAVLRGEKTAYARQRAKSARKFVLDVQEWDTYGGFDLLQSCDDGHGLKPPNALGRTPRHPALGRRHMPIKFPA